ncbi:MAG: hypothetical protein Q7J80_08420 [Anaerolineales bacterium]|nr:hypothetical protein [Anaerolineales bacterium]
MEQLNSAGFRLFTLINSPPHVVEAQLQNAGITGFSKNSFSVDAIRKFKPDAEAYQMTAKELGVAVDQIRMVAAHDWEVAGALLAGCMAAFISRPGTVLNPLMPKPESTGKNLLEVAEKIVRTDG